MSSQSIRLVVLNQNEIKLQVHIQHEWRINCNKTLTQLEPIDKLTENGGSRVFSLFLPETLFTQTKRVQSISERIIQATIFNEFFYWHDIFTSKIQCLN